MTHQDVRFCPVLYDSQQLITTPFRYNIVYLTLYSRAEEFSRHPARRGPQSRVGMPPWGDVWFNLRHFFYRKESIYQYLLAILARCWHYQNGLDNSHQCCLLEHLESHRNSSSKCLRWRALGQSAIQAPLFKSSTRYPFGSNDACAHFSSRSFQLGLLRSWQCRRLPVHHPSSFVLWVRKSLGFRLEVSCAFWKFEALAQVCIQHSIDSSRVYFVPAGDALIHPASCAEWQAVLKEGLQFLCLAQGSDCLLNIRCVRHVHCMLFRRNRITPMVCLVEIHKQQIDELVHAG